MLKETSLAFTLGVMELTGKAQTLGTLTQHFIETYLALALIYLAISLVLEKLLRLFESRLRRGFGREPETNPLRRLLGTPSLGRLLRNRSGGHFPNKEAGGYEA